MDKVAYLRQVPIFCMLEAKHLTILAEMVPQLRFQSQQTRRMSGGMLLATRLNSLGSATFQVRRMRATSVVLLPSSTARIASDTPLRPIQYPEPSSEMALPQPPARSTSPRSLRP